MAKRKAPEVNAGSMADIAFLLLIFFLVTTTIETDSGINRKLPPMEDQIDPPIIREKNIFTVVVNKNNQLLVEESLTDIKDLRGLAMDFLDAVDIAGRSPLFFLLNFAILIYFTWFCLG
jgi:biopolymer transport protein ExbD